MNFDIPKEQSSIIKVIGVGGGGSNAVNHMYEQGIRGVDFIVCNTDQQALDLSPVPVKVQLGANLTEGMGAGSILEVGQNAALEDIEEIRAILEKNTKMVFVTAGMGGGTGSGAAPVVAQAAREIGVLTVGIVTYPFNFEGKKRTEQAEKGIEAMRENVDTLLVICNDRLREMFGNLNLSNAFAQADDVLTTAARGIAEVITVTGKINVDFKDVNTVMKNSGVAVMGSAEAEGDDRAIQAVEKALSSPLLNDNDIRGASHVLLNITYGDQEVLMDEITDITDHIQEEAGDTADVIWGHGYEEKLGDKLSVTIIATGFRSSPSLGGEHEQEPEKNYHELKMDDEPRRVEHPIDHPLQDNYQETAANEEEEDTEKGEPYLKTDEEATGTLGEEPTGYALPSQNDHRNNEAREEDRESDKTTFDEPYLKKGETTDPKENNDPSYSGNEEQSPSEKEEGDRFFLEERWSEEPTSSNGEEYSGGGSTDHGRPRSDSQAREERVSKIRELGMRMKNYGIDDLEKEPAYKRRDVRLEDVPHSSEREVSRYTLTEEENEEGNRQTGIKRNNSFLHDKPD